MKRYVSVAGITLAVLAIIFHIAGFASAAEPFLTDGGVILVGFSVVLPA